MHDPSRETLAHIIQTYGAEVCHSPRRVKGLLLDLCGAHKKEINLLMIALRENVAADLLSLANVVPVTPLLIYLRKRLLDDYALTETAAQWAVESWAWALGVQADLKSQVPQDTSPSSDTALRNVEHLRTLVGHTDSVTGVAFGNDPYTLVSASADRTLRMWDVVRGKVLRTFGWNTVNVTNVALNVDGQFMASSRGALVDVWNVETGECMCTLRGHTGAVGGIAFGPERRYLASSGYDKTVRLWDIYRGTPLHIFEGHVDAVESVAFSPDCLMLASGGWDKTVRVWDLKDGDCRTLEGHTNLVNSVAFSSDGTRLASGSSDETVRLWDLETGACGQILLGHKDSVWSVAFSRDGRFLASAGQDNNVCLWRLSDGTLLDTLVGHSHYVTCVAFSPDGALLASASYDGTVRLWWLD